MNVSSIALEVAGPFAMFARPDSGSTPISYPLPTYSAAKGMFEAVARLSSVYIHPVRVEICAPIRFERYITNYGGPLRKGDQIKKNNNYQLIATILVDVHYRLYAEVREKRIKRGRDDPSMKKPTGRRKLPSKFQQATQRNESNPPLLVPGFVDEFNHRLEKGLTFYTACLGWREFVPSYFGPIREETERDRTINLVITSLLESVWENQEVHPTFRQDWRVKNGVMSYEHKEPSDAE